MCLTIGLLFSSCSKDELLSSEEIELRGGGNNGPNDSNNPKGGGDVDKIAADILTDWTDLLLEIERYSTGMRPNATARALAYIELSGYETMVPGMRRYVSNTKRLQDFQIRDDERARRIDYEIALNRTMAIAIDHFIFNLPADERAKIEAFEEEKRADLIQGKSQNLVEDSESWGEYVANRVIKYSQTDTEAEAQILEPQPTSYEPPTGEGYWTYSADPERALFPYWKSVRTFVVAPEQTTTIAPIPYSENDNSPYYEQMMEVYTINNTAKEEQNDDLWIAEFWSDDVEGIMMSPPARQLSIANQLVKQENLNLAESMRLFVKLGFALNDAAVSTWKYKYDHMVMRPSVFIHEHIDATFETNLYKFIYWPNPSFPGYPSGHSCFASAAAGVFIDVFGNQTEFTDYTHDGRTEFLGDARSFSTLEEMAEENAFSRVPLGVHVRMDCTEGLRLGYEISDAVNELDLRKKPQ